MSCRWNRTDGGPYREEEWLVELYRQKGYGRVSVCRGEVVDGGGVGVGVVL